jgi:hypothetical protein
MGTVASMTRLGAAVVLSLAVTGCSLGEDETVAAPTPAQPAASTPTDAAPEDGQAVVPSDAHVEVPRVSHLRGRPAVRALQAAGFAVRVHDERCPKRQGCGLPIKYVLGTEPAAGTAVRAGRTVALNGYSALADLYCCYNSASKVSQ